MTEDMRLSLERFSAQARQNNRFNPNRDLGGGPDDGGYVWMDSNEEGGPSFEWIDISEVGEQLQPGDDWNSGAIGLGWTFNFYGTDYDVIYVCSNGWASFTSQNSWMTEGDYPNGVQDYGAYLGIQPFDLDARDGGALRFYSNAEEEIAVISWDGIPPYGEGGNNANSFQIVIRGDGSIKFQYHDDNAYTGQNVWVGIQNAEANIGLTAVSLEEGRLVNGYAIGFAPEPEGPPPAVFVDPQSIDTELSTGESFSQDVRIENRGEGRLRYSTDAVILNEPERDAGARGLRGVNREGGPRRDDLEDLMVLIIQDGDGWSPSNEPAAQELGVRYDRISSRQINDVDFGDYTTVITGDEQGDDFFNTIRNNIGLLEDYVAGGGVLIQQVASNSGVQSLLPGGIEDDHAGNNEYNNIEEGADRENPIIAGNPDDESDDLHDRLWGSSVNHHAFSRDQIVNNGDIDDPQIFYSVDGDPNRVTMFTYGY